jgi:hypothetical protein
MGRIRVSRLVANSDTFGKFLSRNSRWVKTQALTMELLPFVGAVLAPSLVSFFS